MLKRSLLTVAILGVFVAAAGAHGEGDVEKAKDLQTPELEFVFEAPPATCGANPIEAQSMAWLEGLLEQQNASRLEEAEAASTYAWSWRGGRSRQCILCSAWMCIVVAC